MIHSVTRVRSIKRLSLPCGVTATLVVFAIVLIVLAVIFIRSNMDGYDVDDDNGDEGLDGDITVRRTQIDDGPRPCYDLLFAGDEMGIMGMDHPYNRSSMFDD